MDESAGTEWAHDAAVVPAGIPRNRASWLGPALVMGGVWGLIDLSLETLTIWPSIVRRVDRISPLPPHWSQVTASEPDAPPLPPQVSQRPSAVNSISFSTPFTASSSVIRRS